MYPLVEASFSFVVLFDSIFYQTGSYYVTDLKVQFPVASVWKPWLSIKVLTNGSFPMHSSHPSCPPTTNIPQFPLHSHPSLPSSLFCAPLLANKYFLGTFSDSAFFKMVRFPCISKQNKCILGKRTTSTQQMPKIYLSWFVRSFVPSIYRSIYLSIYLRGEYPWHNG